MVQSGNVIAGAQGEVLSRSGKLRNVYIATTGDRIWNLREVNVTGAIKYKVSAGVSIPHSELNIPFKTALFAEVLSGTTGEINIVYD